MISKKFKLYPSGRYFFFFFFLLQCVFILIFFNICRTGLKCLPFSKICKTGDVLNDSHAEIIARRGFIKYVKKKYIYFPKLNFIIKKVFTSTS